MSPSALKKRKLNHNPKDSMDADDSPASNSESDAQFSAESEDDAPTSQPQKIPLQHKRAHEDDTMIYAGGDYKSSLFKLQVDELLTEVQPNYEKRLRGVDEALHTLKGLIESFENRDALSVSTVIHYHLFYSN
jgi:U3 small nucleolar RNA-associated protein 22